MAFNTSPSSPVLMRASTPVSGTVPDNMLPGELAFNPVDGALIVGDQNGTPTVQPRLDRPPVMSFCAYGDSRSASSFFGFPPRFPATGYLNWAAMLTNGRLRPVDQPNFGVAGETSAQITARLGQVLASPARAVVLLGSVNDATGTDSATPMVALAKSLAANGKLVIALPELPRATTGGGWDASRVSQHLRVRQAILDLQGTPGIIVADPWPYMADPAGNGGPLPGILFDVPALHPAPLGHYYIGRAIADVVNTIMPAPSLLPVVNGGFFNATFGVNCMLNTNPLLTGTAGTVSGAGVTGSVADGWTATATANLTVAASKVMKNGVEWQQFIVSGTAADANQQLTLTQAIPVGNVTTGDKLETVCQIDVDAGTAGLWGPSLEVTPTGPGSFLSSTNWNSGGTSSGPPVNVAHTGVLRAPNYPVTSGLTQLLVGITCRAVQSVACSATFRVRSIGCRKLV